MRHYPRTGAEVGRSLVFTGVFQGLSGAGLRARVARSASWTVVGYGTSQALRLASNLLLTRLLFPEAFGLMALISTILIGLMLFSDIGVGPAIAQSRRGDDPDFLDTAWTMQVMRGISLWAVAALLAWPVAQFYGQPELLTYLPLAGLTLIITGFNPTRVESANRHLTVGRLTLLELISQVIELLCLALLALWLQSVLALVLGAILGALIKLVILHRFLPGQRNRLRLERRAMGELVHFGKWIFLSTAFTFFASQGDKLVLGKVLSMAGLGIYNIGFFIAGFPVQLMGTMANRIMIPVYREGAAPARISRLRYLMSAVGVGLLVLLALIGPWLIQLLYDDRYLAAGTILVVLALVQMPLVIGFTYDQAALASGQSRRFFFYKAAQAVLQFGLLLLGAFLAGLPGALAGYGLATLLSHLVLIRLARAQGVWDPKHDLAFALVMGVTLGAVLLLHGETLARQLALF